MSYKMSDKEKEFSKLDTNTQEFILTVGKYIQTSNNMEKVLNNQLEPSDDRIVVSLKKITFFPPVDIVGIPLNREVNITIHFKSLSDKRYRYTYKYVLRNKNPIVVDYLDKEDIFLLATKITVMDPYDDKSDPKDVAIASSPSLLPNGHLGVSFISHKNLSSWKANLYSV